MQQREVKHNNLLIRKQRTYEISVRCTEAPPEEYKVQLCIEIHKDVSDERFGAN